ncbi:MAG: nucleotidyl transferase AbiEii/AbiGii toxin family protein, partial [Bdellovibrionales bacterium]|nr:nucleotidyl transferase AbiEii/AbiGii toxin family protein [Bdellovibrionales bacterium]
IEANKDLNDKLIFKGGFVLLKTLASDRFTRDLDALAREIDKEKVVPLVEKALKIHLNDGLFYGTPEISDLTDQGDYGGYRIHVPFEIGELPNDERKLKKLSRVHLDIGFGDVVFGRVKRTNVPTILESQEPISWKVYPLECIYAEKLQTLVSRGAANSRAKDLYDLVVIFDEVKASKTFSSALRKTFKNRETELPGSFSEFVRTLDFTILERSWGSVELSGGTMTFGECHKRLLTIMKQVDKLKEVDS